ncbi:MAG: hypothetical protein HY586_03910 [Candidatus Omnitrophica bacterium]|nr:hypothetical protein [Candidatus Omnitrophota bacterium]
MARNRNICLKDFEVVDWQVAVQTYGNNHATLIGLIVSWWNRRAKSNRVLEAGPSIGNFRNKKRGQCDALLYDANGPAVVLEVEGYKFPWILRKLGKCLTSRLERLSSVHTGVLVAYEYGPGEGISVKKLSDFATKFTKRFPGKKLIVITVNKSINERLEKGNWLKSHPYYRCVISSINGYEFVAGRLAGQKKFHESKVCELEKV